MGMRYLLLVGLGLAALFAAKAYSAGNTHTISIDGMKFVPSELTVAVGDTIVWTNKDLVMHTVTDLSKNFDSGNVMAGKSWQFTVGKSGNFSYRCRFHPTMKALLIVK